MPTALLANPKAVRRYPVGFLAIALVLWAITFAMIGFSLAFPIQANGMFTAEMIGL